MLYKVFLYISCNISEIFIDFRTEYVKFHLVPQSIRYKLCTVPKNNMNLGGYNGISPPLICIYLALYHGICSNYVRLGFWALGWRGDSEYVLGQCALSSSEFNGVSKVRMEFTMLDKGTGRVGTEIFCRNYFHDSNLSRAKQLFKHLWDQICQTREGGANRFYD